MVEFLNDGSPVITSYEGESFEDFKKDYREKVPDSDRTDEDLWFKWVYAGPLKVKGVFEANLVIPDGEKAVIHFGD